MILFYHILAVLRDCLLTNRRFFGIIFIVAQLEIWLSDLLEWLSR